MASQKQFFPAVGEAVKDSVSTAVFSPCRKWRYVLTREWDTTKSACAFIGLNPSTADETTDDNTVRRCINFAKLWGYGKLVMLNIFAYRSTDPNGLYSVDDPVGKENDFWIEKMAKECDVVVGAWGNHGAFRGRCKEVLDLLWRKSGLTLMVLGVTGEHQPKHPLYVKKDLKPVSYSNAISKV